MPQYTESVEIGSPAARVWEVLATPERWSEGYLETRLRSPDYPNPDSRNDHVYRTRIKEDVAARVIRSEPPRRLEEAKRGQDVLLSRALPARAGRRAHPRHRGGRDQLPRAGPAGRPLAARDVRGRWRRSLERETAERG
jgi:hypothetical protein